MKTSLRVALIVGVLIAVVAGLAVKYSADQQPNRGIALDELSQLFQPEAKPLGLIVVQNYREFRGNSIRWSAVYFGCVFGSAFLSALAALILKLELLGNHPKLRNDLAALLATSAALLVTLSTTGNFERKWQANRSAAAEMENLAYELTRTSIATNLDAIVTRMQTINSTRNQAIVGEGSASNSREQALPVTPEHPGPGEGADKIPQH
nr:hypothetical protein [uncultured Desulfobulbus sp.]